VFDDLSCIATSKIADLETRRISETGLGEGDRCTHTGSYQIQTTLIEVRGKDADKWKETVGDRGPE